MLIIPFLAKRARYLLKFLYHNFSLFFNLLFKVFPGPEAWNFGCGYFHGLSGLRISPGAWLPEGLVEGSKAHYGNSAALFDFFQYDIESSFNDFSGDGFGLP